MSQFQQRLIGWLQILGGVAMIGGTAISVRMMHLLQTLLSPVEIVASLIGSVGFALLCVVAGYLLIRSQPAGRLFSVIAQAVQVLGIHLGSLNIQIFAGAQLGITITGAQSRLAVGFGSHFGLFSGQGSMGWGLTLNMVPLIALYWLRKGPVHPSPVGEKSRSYADAV